MKSALRILLGSLGVPAMMISLSILLLGAGATGSLGERTFNMLSGTALLSPEWPATMDSELRFYAALFLAFGVLTTRAAWNLDRHRNDVPWLALVFFLGGLGRALSWLQVGAPHPFFIALMTIELTVPPLIAGLWLATRQVRSPASQLA